MPELKYINRTRQFIHDALELIRSGAKESRIRENFTSYLRLMFAPDVKWVDKHIVQGETSIRLNRKGHLVSGFIDNCIDNIAIEYEKNLSIKSVFDEGHRQVREYCAAFANNGTSLDILTGILSDTLNWFVYAIKDNGLVPGQYTQDNIELQLIDELHVTDNSELSAINLINFLTKHLGQVGGRELSATALSNDFGLNSKYTSHYISSVVDYVNLQIQKNPNYYSLIEKLWSSFVDIESDVCLTPEKVASIRETYSHEFYISIIAKLLGANILSKKAIISSPTEIKSIISGTFFENKGIYNFADYDYFGWISNDSIDEIIPVLIEIQADLSIYDYSKISKGDIFGSILVQLANKNHRLLLGQELTPFWLSKLLVSNVVAKLNGKELPQFVDMCCGSGSMLIATIDETKKLISTLNRSEAEAAILSCCTGFDIDPLATILAKINWLINVADIIDFSKGIYIPIYHSDSLFISSLVSATDDDSLDISLYDKTIRMPKILIRHENQQLFDGIVNKCHDLTNIAVTFEDIRSYISGTYDLHNFNDFQKQQITQFTFDLYLAMFTLNREGRNGLWAFVLKNSLRPNLIHANFNGIVSNTPWLSMSKIADNPYKNNLKALARQYNILPTGSSSHHIEMATIFLVSSISRYLCDDGVFGCILPHSILNGNHHTQFRLGEFQTATTPVNINFDSIWLLPENVFKNKSVVLFGSKAKFNVFTKIPGRIIGNNISEQTDFAIRNSGDLTIWTNEEIVVQRKDFEYYKFTQGADIMPRSLFFFNIIDNTNSFNISPISISSQYSYFLKDMKAGKDFKVAECSIPKTLFFDVLLSHSLTPFAIASMPKAFLPIKKNENGFWEEISEADVRFMPRSAQNTIRSIINKFTEIKPGKKIFKDALNIRNKLTNQNLPSQGYLVVYGAGGSRTCAAILPLYNHSHRLIIDQTIYYHITDSIEEALFITGLLNSKALELANSAFQAEGALGKRHIHTLPATSLPPYDCQNTKHLEFVESTRSVIYDIRRNVPIELLNPNNGSVSVRRSKIYNIIDKLPSYISCNNIALEILNS